MLYDNLARTNHVVWQHVHIVDTWPTRNSTYSWFSVRNLFHEKIMFGTRVLATTANTRVAAIAERTQ